MYLSIYLALGKLALPTRRLEALALGGFPAGPTSMGRRERGTEGADVACALARYAWRRLMSRGPSHELSADRDVMLAAVRCDATFLKYAATALRAAV